MSDRQRLLIYITATSPAPQKQTHLRVVQPSAQSADPGANSWSVSLHAYPIADLRLPLREAIYRNEIAVVEPLLALDRYF